MYLPSYALNIIYEATPRATRSILATTTTDTWTVTDLRCSATVKADDTKNPNTAEIKLWNVSPDSLSKMTNLGDVSLLAGYADEDQGVIFRGNILGCEIKQEADGVVTTLQCSDGGRAHALANMQVSFKPASTSNQIINSVLDRVVNETGLAEGNVRRLVSSLTPFVYRRGFSDSGNSLRILFDLLNAAGVSLSIQGMQLQAVLTNKPSNTVTYDLSPTSGLIGSPDTASMQDTVNTTKADIKAATKAKAKAKLVKLNCFLLPLIQINQEVHVTSKGKQGWYTVSKLEHKFDTHGSSPWTTNLEVK